MERDEFANALKNVKLQGFVWPDPEDAGDLRIVKNVIEAGCHIIGVEKEIGEPQFTYSIGLYLNYLQPEIMIVEMEPRRAADAINRIASHLKSGGSLEVGVTYDQFDDRVPFRFRELQMEKHTDELGFAIWFYCSRSGRLKFPVYQAMWPDRSGRFPSDSECDAGVVKAQTLR